MHARNAVLSHAHHVPIISKSLTLHSHSFSNGGEEVFEGEEVVEEVEL